LTFYFPSSPDPRDLHSFPTRRSSDLIWQTDLTRALRRSNSAPVLSRIRVQSLPLHSLQLTCLSTARNCFSVIGSPSCATKVPQSGQAGRKICSPFLSRLRVGLRVYACRQ